MKVAATLVLATAAVAAVQAANIKPLILGGTVVPAGTKTYTVGTRFSTTGRTFCGGSLISPTHVLSAAHCQGVASFVAIGTHFATGTTGGELIAVKGEIVHPKFVDATLNYDYAILELATPSKFAPIKLLSADSDTFAGETSTVMGWGSTREGNRTFSGLPSNELLRVDVPVVTRADCLTRGLESFPLSETMFCAGGATNKDGCQGDSGGPIILERPAEDLLIVVVSWGDGCGRTDKPGVYSKVSFVKDWIQSIAPNATWV